LALARAIALSYYIVGYPGTLAEYIGIISGVTTQPAAPYEMRIEVVVADLCAYHRQGLAVLVVMV
jgi:hypothetical protein